MLCAESGKKINRKALVDRHRVSRTAADILAPLTVGNGELGFTVDVTGLQTFPEQYDPQSHGKPAMPLGTMAQWSFHEMPNPNGWSLEDVTVDYESLRGSIPYPAGYDFRIPAELSRVQEPEGYWLWTNPHRFDLGRFGLRLLRSDGTIESDIAQIKDIEQTLDLWSGKILSSFTYRGRPFRVTTTCAPHDDVLAVRVESPAITEGVAALTVKFPYASDTFGNTVDWSRPEAHLTKIAKSRGGVAIFDREMDETRYRLRMDWVGDELITQEEEHCFVLSGTRPVLDVTMAFAEDDKEFPVRRGVDNVLRDAAQSWKDFWSTGAAMSFEGSEDPRASELERRVILSQYVTAVNSAGRFPPAETGLVKNSWAGKFHLEMHWWHSAHFAMWGRPDLLERSFSWYLAALPVAKEIAGRQGYSGARWPKHVGPEGRESPNVIGPLLVWQQPHPVHMAELLRRTGTDSDRIVATYSEVVEETAAFIASFLEKLDDGKFHLTPPIMPAQETYDPDTVYDPPFELAYFWWALSVAQKWRVLRGEEPRADWDEVLENFAPLPVHDGVLSGVDRPARTDTNDHPSLLGALGVVPKTPLVEEPIMRATIYDVIKKWDWPRAWGWDFPLLSMCCARLGNVKGAIEALVMDTPRNLFLPNGYNCQDPMELPLYLPGNGGLLAAASLFAGTFDGSQYSATEVAGWKIQAEGFPSRP